MERCDGNLLLLGDDEEKERTYERLIRTWNGREGALVVFDSRGWGEKYGDGHLAASGAGNVPDYLQPVLQHPELGATPAAAAEYLAPICTPKSFRLNVGNDEFWENMAFQTNAQYLEYQVALLKQEDDGHALRTAAKRHRLLLDGMEAIALSNKDEIEGQIKKSRRSRPSIEAPIPGYSLRTTSSSPNGSRHPAADRSSPARPRGKALRRRTGRKLKRWRPWGSFSTPLLPSRGRSWEREGHRTDTWRSRHFARLRRSTPPWRRFSTP
ncbi:hypothetical protein [Fretibacterium fastidiosum]|uniref:Rhodanese domain-containing protein n=1 Tax=Fretibacterium fastidiosum TaxID=651822 RepID=A0AB94IXJ3_9BACT|nr:hypothetical protein [Fretibacterium fastidiosum]CBL28461.1 hypothetical protein SY1_13750 [Fretibacterium fastidiosum]